MDRLLVITNAAAGSNDEVAVQSAVSVLRERVEVEVAVTCSPEELDEVLRAAEERRLVVAGGDGSLHAVVAGLHRLGRLGEVELALLPLGTGNDFARGTGIPLQPGAAALVARDGRVGQVDVLVADDGGVVVNGVHVGAGAQASRLAKVWKERLGRVGVGRFHLGKLGYPIGALLAALRKPSVHLRVEVDGEVVATPEESLLMVAIGNGPRVGGGTSLTPEADPGDGDADVLISRSVGNLARLAYVARLSRGVHHKAQDVSYQHGREIRVSGARFYTAADGELTGPHHDRSWRLERAAFTMRLPEQEQVRATPA